MKIMTYNIRYANDNDGENAWALRKDHLTAQLQFYEPDVFGVQEALSPQLEHFKQVLTDYSFVGVGRNSGDEEGESNAIFYKKEQFQVLKQHTFWLSETPEKASKSWDAKFPRICTCSLFREKLSKKKFWIFNTHLDHIGEYARQKGAKLILKKMEELNPEDHPVVLMGDLNAEPESETYRILAENMNDSRKHSKLVFGPAGTFNAYEFDRPVTRRIDYIFTRKNNVEVLKYAVLTDSKDLKYPSDHFPIFVELDLK